MQKKYWFLLSAAVVGSIWFIYQYFDQAVPLVHVTITMNAQQAQQEARNLAQKYQWNLDDYQLATQFQEEQQLQSFVELEGGGKSAFINMIEKNYYQPYQWRVRFFKPGTIQETIVTFTPVGTANEFFIKFPEDQTGVDLEREQASKIALDGAHDWGIDLQPYQLVEYNRQVVPSGRVDHSFVYERDDVSLEKGKFRIELKVSGDVFSGINRSVKIPDEFNRRYAQMYATNKLIAGLTKNIAIFFYLFVFGLWTLLFFYQRPGSLRYRGFFVVMSVFAALRLLSVFNKWPLIWNSYPTHLSTNFFILQQLGGICIQIFLFALFVWIIAILTEAAGRFVFGDQIQFLSLWSSGVAGSLPVLEQTVIGYASAIIFLGYAVGFSLLSQHWGWWSPLTNLIDPNILSTRVPFFSPIIMAAFTGFWEEFATRGLPIAAISLLTRNSKYKGWWFVGMFVMQAIIFGALHANYPQQPAYCRVVELMIPSFGFGYMYYVFGLLPGIICHFVYDAILMALPVFISDLLWHKFFAVMAILIPFFIVIGYWFMQGRRWLAVSSWAYNRAANVGQVAAQQVKDTRIIGLPIVRRAYCGAIVVGFIGIGLMWWSGKFEFQTPAMQILPTQAEKIAQSKIKDLFDLNPDGWTINTLVVNPTETMGNKFIWQTYGNQEYQRLQSSYVIPPFYAVKWLKFDGPVEERAESLEVVVAGDGAVLGVLHSIPEFYKGADLSQQQALDKAYLFLKGIYELDKQEVSLISCDSVKHEHRRDWTIVFKDDAHYQLQSGQARIMVKLSGDNLASIHRLIHAPEEWQRSEENRMSQEQLLKTILYFIVSLWFLIFAIQALSTYGINVTLFKSVAVLLLIYVLLRLINFANAYREVIGYFSTDEPLSYQFIQLLSSSLMHYVALGGFLSLFIIWSRSWAVTCYGKKSLMSALVGIMLGFGVTGVEAFVWHFQTKYSAYGSSFNFVNFEIPTIAIIIPYFILNMLITVVTLVSMLVSIVWLSARFPRLPLMLPLFIVSSMILSDAASFSNMFLWIMSGVVSGLLWYVIYRYFIMHSGVMLWFIAFGMSLAMLLPLIWATIYPGILLQGVIGSVVVFGLVMLAYRRD